MKPVKHILNAIWDQYPDAIADHYQAVKVPNMERLFGDIFVPGSYYYYVLDIVNSTLSHFHPQILPLHGLESYPLHLKEIIDLIHPDDLAFVTEAEAWSFKKINEIGTEHLLNLKSGYCFRMKTADDSYQLFHHQAIHTAQDDNGKLVQAVNIHTNIHHITEKNKYTVTVTGINQRTDFYQETLKPALLPDNVGERLTKRELEIFMLLLKGYSDKEIALLLFLSYHTVRTHHKNILSKTNSKNSIELIRKSLENGCL